MDRRAPGDPMLPAPYRVMSVRREVADTFTLDLEPAEGGRRPDFAPGQFNMLYRFGVGEVPISISGDPADRTRLVHTIRAVGSVTDSLESLTRGEVVGVRGPFGTPWPVEAAEGSDVIVVGGGIGLAPLRPIIYHVLANRERYGKLIVLYGARLPAEILYRRELEKWRGRFDAYVDVTVDHAQARWAGNVGVVTRLIPRARFDPYNATAFVCGPEIMIRFAVQALREQGIGESAIYVSMERNMKCAVGFCGHCQFGPHFVCKDGPVFAFAAIRDLFALREL